MVLNKVSHKNKLIVSIIIMLLIPIIMSLYSMAWEGYPDTGYEETYQMFIAEEKDTGHIYAVRSSEESLNENFIWLYVNGDRIDARTTSYGISLRKNRWLEDTQTWGATDFADPFYFEEILQSNANIYSDIDKTSVFFFCTEANNPTPSPNPTPTPYPDEPPGNWYTSILDWVTDSIGGILEGLAVPFQNIAEGINKIFQLFNPENAQNIFRILFVPRPEYLQENIEIMYGIIEQKIPLLNDLILIVKGMAESLIIVEVNTPPQFKISMPEKWGGFEANIIDFSIFVPYRFFIVNIIRAIAWYFFIKRLLRRMPNLIY